MAATSLKTHVICLTPVRNEAWILERFLRAAELWADRIILADQRSTDGTRRIASGFRKVRVIENPSSSYDEGGRQRLLLDAARELEGRKLLVALDADEFLTPTWSDSPQWRAALTASPGTVLRFDWVNVLPGGQSAYIPPQKVPFAVIDDGRDHTGELIHSTRVPVRESVEMRDVEDVKVLHLQFTDWQRMKSKQRWYQCWEMLHNPKKRPIQIYRQYHQMDAFPTADVHPVDSLWLTRYAQSGVQLDATKSSRSFWWDHEVLDWILEHGHDHFKKLDIWDVSWPDVATELGLTVEPGLLADPRGPLEQGIHRWLANSQNGGSKTRTRWFQRLLIPFGW